MDYYCDVNDETIKFKSKIKHLHSKSHVSFDECIRIKQTIQSRNFFDLDEIFNHFITKQN